MRIPRDVSGEDLIRHLGHFGYVAIRQSGSHVRLTRSGQEGEHHITVPLHRPLRIGTLNSIVNDVAAHLSLDKTEFVRQLFG